MKLIKYDITQDGTLLDQDLQKKYDTLLNYRDIVGKEEGNYVNFVGFIINEDRVLVSFPKHFLAKEQRETMTDNPIKIRKYTSLLFRVIFKYSKKNSEKHIGVKKELNRGYPFQQFFNIYSYYKKYGLFTNEREIKKFGYHGNISWKDTIRKSPMLVNDGNLLYIPMVIKNKVNDYVFISKCMTHVVNSTINRFSLFLDLNKIPLDTNDIDFNNREFVISKLKKLSHSLFKDIDKQLIKDLIFFFENEKYGTRTIQTKIYTFNLIWEELVNSYLTKHFININPVTKHLQINENKIYNNNFHKPLLYPDIRNKVNTKNHFGYRLEPDSYLIKDTCRYIFDAKYYQNIHNLNYKQVSYYFLLKWHNSDMNSTGNEEPLETYNGLILPTDTDYKMKTHFSLNPDFNKDEKSFVIIEYYLNVLKLMNNYI